MKDMAQLRLKAEVSQLEGSLKSTDAQPKLPPYLVSDALSLCEHLALMKQLAASSKFIVIIPVSGQFSSYFRDYFSVKSLLIML